MSSPDIRAGVALLIAALSAEGKSTIQNIEQIDRGYQNIDERLNNLGADIKRINIKKVKSPRISKNNHYNGPSGAGKTSITRHLDAKHFLNLHFQFLRQQEPRANEKDGSGLLFY